MLLPTRNNYLFKTFKNSLKPLFLMTDRETIYFLYTGRVAGEDNTTFYLQAFRDGVFTLKLTRENALQLGYRLRETGAKIDPRLGITTTLSSILIADGSTRLPNPERLHIIGDAERENERMIFEPLTARQLLDFEETNGSQER